MKRRFYLLTIFVVLLVGNAHAQQTLHIDTTGKPTSALNLTGGNVTLPPLAPLLSGGTGTLNLSGYTITLPTGSAATSVNGYTGAVTGAQAVNNADVTLNSATTSVVSTATGVLNLRPQNGRIVIGDSGTNYEQAGYEGYLFSPTSLGLLGWSTDPGNLGALNTGISRIGPAAIAIGNGTPGDASGSLKLTTLTASGTISGNGPGLSITTYGAIADGSTDCTAAIQAAHDALPVGGGKIVIPPGTFNVAGTVNIGKVIILEGAGGTLQTSSATGGMFVVSANGCRFRGLVFVNTAASPTAGSFINASASNGVIVDSCTFLGGWAQLVLGNGPNRHVRASTFTEFRCYGLDLSNNAVPDSGDDEISGCYFGTSHAAAGVISACVHWPSASGLKIIGNKCNGGVGGNSTFGVWVDLRYGPGQMNDFIVTGNSFENLTDSGICVSYDGTHGNTGQGLNSIEILGANQIFNCGVAAITLFRYPAGSTVPTGESSNIHVGGAVIKQCPIGVYAGPCSNCQIESDILYGDNVPRALVTDPATLGYIAPQHRTSPGFLIEGAGDGMRAVYLSRDTQAVITAAPQVLYRAAVPVQNGGRIKVVSTGILQGSGPYCSIMERAYTRTTGGVTLTQVGTDTAVGSAASTPLALDVATNSGEIDVTQSVASGTATNAKLTLEIDGVLTSLKVGP